MSVINDMYPIVLMLEGGETAQYPHAVVYNDAGVFQSEYDLSHVTDGCYTSTGWTPTVADYYHITKRVYTDAGRTTSSSTYGNVVELVNITASDTNSSATWLYVSLTTQIDANETKIDALNNISTGDVLTQATSALNTYDPPTNNEMQSMGTYITTDLTVEIDANEGKIDTLTTNVGNLNDLSLSQVESVATWIDKQRESSVTWTYISLTTQIDANETKIDALNDISTADVLTQATSALNTYDAPTNNEMQSMGTWVYVSLTTQIDANETKIDTVDTVVDAIKTVTDLMSFTGNDIKCTLDGETVSISGTTATLSALWTALNNSHGTGSWETGAGGSGGITTSQATQAATDALTTYDPPTNNEMQSMGTYITTDLTTEIDANETKIDTTITDIGNLNDISTGDVLTQATGALTTYDAPTNNEMQSMGTWIETQLTTEIDANETKIDTAITDIAGLNDISVANVQTACDTAITANTMIVDMTSSVTFIRDIEKGRWIRDGTTMKFYKDDNVTLVATFNLKKADGTAAGETDDVYERVAV